MIIAISGKKQSGKDTVAKIIQYLTTRVRHSYNYLDFINPDVNYGIANTPTLWSYWEIHRFAGALKVFVSQITGIPLEDLEKEEVKNQLMGEEWIRYGYADGFQDVYKNGEKTRQMISVPCSKERYEQELRINWQTAYKHHPTVREMLTGIGNDALKKWNPNIWINATFAKYIAPMECTEVHGAIIAYKPNPIFDSELFPKWIIPDLRYKDELAACEKRGAITIRVDRFMPLKDWAKDLHIITPDHDALSRRVSAEYYLKWLKESKDIDRNAEWEYDVKRMSHISETDLDDAAFKYRIVNDAGIHELVEKVHRILKEENII